MNQPTFVARIAAAVVLAFCLADCTKHANGRYDAVPVPDSANVHINGQGVRIAEVTDGAHKKWFLVHADGTREGLTGLPDNAQVRDINDKEELTGFFGAPDCTGDNCPFHPFIVSNGSFHDLGTLGANSARPEAINNNGDIAGALEVSINPRPCYHPFVYSGGKVSDLGAPPGYCGTAIRSNEKGDVLISYVHIDAGGRTVESSAEYRNGSVTTLLSGEKLKAYDINASGEIAGTLATADGNYHGVVIHADGSSQDFGTGGNCCSAILGIDDGGMLVGYIDTGRPSQDGSIHNILRAVIFQGDKIVDLNGLIDWNDTDRGKDLVAGVAQSVSNDGEIYCSVYDAQGRYVGGYILRPELK